MTERLKTSTIYKANSKVIGIDSEAHAEYIADFEANHKASTEIVTDYLIAETTAARSSPEACETIHSESGMLSGIVAVMAASVRE